jgi:16S rRNA (guanine527-N7)-methyltransferase
MPTDNGRLRHYFPEISEQQIAQFAALGALYAEWNAKINVVSRKDIDNLYERHVLHSLSIAKFLKFTDGTTVIDVGTGGGFPGIPLAILQPNAQFHLIDSTGKKIKVAQAVAEAIDLKNVTTRQCRIEEEKGLFDFVVSRAVMPLPDLVKAVKKNIHKRPYNALPNGLLCLKGGDLQNELAPFGKNVICTELTAFFDEAFFQTKKIIYIAL